MLRAGWVTGVIDDSNLHNLPQTINDVLFALIPPGETSPNAASGTMLAKIVSLNDSSWDHEAVLAAFDSAIASLSPVEE